MFAAALDLLMAMCDRVSRQQLVPDLAERVFPTLLDGVFGPLVAKMTDASSRVRRKATNALMYVATFGEAAGGDGAPLLVQRVLQDAGKNTVLPRMQVSGESARASGSHSRGLRYNSFNMLAVKFWLPHPNARCTSVFQCVLSTQYVVLH